jgi:thiamine biosynthesis lipoprotein
MAPFATAPSFAHVAINAARSEVRLPAGARIDLGGIGKGYAVDRAVELLSPIEAFLVDAGGDIAARGGLDAEGWIVSIADPCEAERDIAVVRLRDEAIATSTTQRRRWRRGSEVHNHLIDPRSGSSTNNGLAQVSVIAPTAVEADVFAKSALILGEHDGARLIEDAGFSALFVRRDGTRSTIGRWPAL